MWVVPPVAAIVGLWQSLWIGIDMHTRHHSAAYRAVNIAGLLVWTAAVFISRRVQQWMMKI